jgi:hypothetical protein
MAQVEQKQEDKKPEQSKIGWVELAFPPIIIGRFAAKGVKIVKDDIAEATTGEKVALGVSALCGAPAAAATYGVIRYRHSKQKDEEKKSE